MAVTANKLITRKEPGRNNLPIAATTHIYQGTGVFVNSDGNADDDTATGANAFAGIAECEVDNTGSAGDKRVELLTKGVFLMTGAGTYTQADVGKDAFLTDNYTLVVADGAAAVRIGKVVEFYSATQLWVEIEVINFVQQTALTALLTAVTHTAPGTPDYAIQDLINSNAYGFVTKDEGNTVLKVVAALQVSVSELQTKLKAVGILA